MNPIVTLLLVAFVLGIAWLVVRFLPSRCWQCGELTKCKSPGGLYMCADCGGRDPCEGCGKPSVAVDTEGVYLCRDCYDASPHAAHCPCRECKLKSPDKQLAETLEEEMTRIEEGRQP